tara:strand:+ start:41 stop:226 length:186 start_codon:yes stop_codon:yes gene_type:complete
MADKIIKKDSSTEEIYAYLELLKESGITNMLGSVPYIMAEFNINKIEARNLLISWIKTHKK